MKSTYYLIRAKYAGIGLIRIGALVLFLLTVYSFFRYTLTAYGLTIPVEEYFPAIFFEPLVLIIVALVALAVFKITLRPINSI